MKITKKRGCLVIMVLLIRHKEAMNELIHSQILKAETQNHHTSHSLKNLMIDITGEHRINMNERFKENKMNGNSSNFVCIKS